MKTARRQVHAPAAILAALAAAGCGDMPFTGDGGSTSSVRFNLAGARTSAGTDVCAEIDAAALTTRISGRADRIQQQTPTGCGADFTVTVPKGRVQFEGSLSGGQRPLLRGSAATNAEEDGFRVVIDLSEIDALQLRTRTLGAYGPTLYQYRVGGADDFAPIGKDDEITLGALAGGPRRVTLNPLPCAVVNGPPELDVDIPADENELGDHEFEVDCNIGGGLTIRTVTTGPGPAPYTLDLSSDAGSVSTTIGPNETQVFSDVGPGPFAILLTVPSPSTCSVLDDAPPEPFMAVDGALTVTFEIQCVTVPPATGSIVIDATTPGTPGSGQDPTFDYTVRDLSSTITRSGVLTANQSVTVPALPVVGNPYTVTLAPTPNGTCVVTSSPSVTVQVPADGVVRAKFDIGC